jgi:four helix bundle protein
MNIALEKSRKFVIRIYNLYKYLCGEKKEYVLAKQLLRSGTSIGANLAEAQYSISKKEFLAKTTIAMKECAETGYWLDLLKETKILTQEEKGARPNLPNNGTPSRPLLALCSLPQAN